MSGMNRSDLFRTPAWDINHAYIVSVGKTNEDPIILPIYFPPPGLAHW